MIDEILERKAYKLAERGHFDTTRKDGKTPYIKHPVEVVQRLWSWGVCDSEVIAAAYAHDLLEDTDITVEEIENELGTSVLNKVKLLTKRKDISKTEYITELSKTDDLSVLLIKASDRMCNTVDFMLLRKTNYAQKYLIKATEIFDRIEKEKDKIDVYEKYKLDLAFLKTSIGLELKREQDSKE